MLTAADLAPFQQWLTDNAPNNNADLTAELQTVAQATQKPAASVTAADQLSQLSFHLDHLQRILKDMARSHALMVCSLPRR